MKIITIASILFFFIGHLIAEEESTEAIYRRVVEASANGHHEEALIHIMRLYHISADPRGSEMHHGETPFHINELFTIGNTLIQLKRWEEARFCLTKFLIHVQSPEQLQQTFGAGFSPEDWLEKNPIEEQPFYKHSISQ